MATATAPPDTRVVLPDDLPWATWMEGLQVKILRSDLDNNEYTLLVRFAPGIELPRHRHFGQVHAHTIQGRWHYLEYDWVAEAGSYVHEPASSVHTLKVFDDNTEETVVLFVMQGGLVLLGPNDEVWMYEDAESAMERYLLALEQEGKSLPDGLVL